MSWDFETDPDFEQELAWMRTFVREEVWPLETVEWELDEAAFFAEIKRLQAEVKRRGFWAAHLPSSLGGQGYGQVRLALMHEISGASIWWGPIVFGNQAPDSGNAEILANYGTPDQRDRWLAPLLRGDIRSAFSMTEAQTAGSDPVGLATTATLDGDEWVVNGEKWFTSNGMNADVLIVMAVTDPDAPRHARASMIIVPVDALGVDRVRNIASMEAAVPFGYGHAEVRYENVRVPAENLLGKRGAGSRSPRRGSARAVSTTACAGWGSRKGRSTSSASANCSARWAESPWPPSRPCDIGSPTARPTSRRHVS
jgi:acyl-CoA dehydrogenase